MTTLLATSGFHGMIPAIWLLLPAVIGLAAGVMAFITINKMTEQDKPLWQRNAAYLLTAAVVYVSGTEMVRGQTAEFPWDSVIYVMSNCVIRFGFFMIALLYYQYLRGFDPVPLKLAHSGQAVMARAK